ncbi:hypothetical protein [Microbacterium sp. Leaf151]|uniref:hypothetical protein n=1 Tax=Microbacterium sp. Leaf151 TaxID=1736276 RepID=UPI0006FCA40E|nr:hypothetical protein [Microbacterium sp. Leaf151]KQR19370.1 hypothetical protein ASF76_16350 [Microbacterium sp. Leaf151]
MSTRTISDAGGAWWLSLLYIAVVLALAVSAVLSLGVAPLLSASDISSVDVTRTLGGVAAVGGAPVLTWICLRVRAVRSRLRPGAASIAASATTMLAVGWTCVVVVGYRESAEDVWGQLPVSLGICAPALVVALCALSISRPVQRDHDRRASAARRGREASLLP